MSEVVKTDPAPKAMIAAGNGVSAIVPSDIDQTYRLAQALANSGDMIPQHFQRKPEIIMAAIMKGMEIGLAPMQALSHIAVINGRATIWGDAIPALMLRSGHHIDVDYEGEGDDLKAVATLTRGDSGKQIVRTFSIADAKRAGLLNKKGPWQQYPQRMLAHRARTWAARDGAADALMGLQVSEEVQDYGPDAARDVSPDRPRRGRSHATFQPAISNAPNLAPIEDDPAPEVDEINEGEIINDALTPEQRAELEQAQQEFDSEAAGYSQ